MRSLGGSPDACDAGNSRLFQDDNIENVYNTLFSGQDTAHQAFQLLEKRLDLQIRVLAFLRHVFKRTLHFKPSRKGLTILGGTVDGNPYQIIDECHGLKELITILTFLYDDTFSVLGIDEPELHLHPQFQRFLLDELRQVAGNPDEKGKKLIFLVTHSPILLDLRRLDDLASIVVFEPGSKPRRADLEKLDAEAILKVRQALPSFHAGQRELLFCNNPIFVEGPTDAAILLNVATKLELPLGAAGIGIASMGGKYQLLAYRALLGSLAKSNARFVLDLDAAVTPRVLSCLDRDDRVVEHLAASGSGERSLSKVSGELISLIRVFVKDASHVGLTIEGVKADPDGSLSERQLGLALRGVLRSLEIADDKIPRNAAQTIEGKFALIRSAARAAGVLILSKGPIESYYGALVDVGDSDFAKQQALQLELDAIWTNQDQTALKARYQELLEFLDGAGYLSVPISDMAREPVANLVHLLQTDIRLGRIRSRDDAVKSARVIAEGYWFICELGELVIRSEADFVGFIKMKDWLGGDEIRFDSNTRAYNVTIRPTAIVMKDGMR